MLKRLLFFIFSTGIITMLYGQDKTLSKSIERGAAVYQDFCVTCHLPDGKGVEGVYPPLAGSDYLMSKRAASIRGIKFGQRGPIEVNGITYDNTMMPMGLKDQEVADVMNYIRNRLGNKTEEAMVTEAEVAQIGRN
ncbi:c-type cytochrome [Robiginitalea sp. IMCC43444]|uniref:c-type cytochrome n=1 Tax=Robiginitalea sp. IMCC43444 TaxID=3459121 RepID=UPI0040429AE8